MSKRTYYELLTKVRHDGDWETWIEFFLTGVRDTSDQAVKTAREMLAIFENDRRWVQELGASSPSALLVHQHAQKHPLLSLTHAAQHTGVGFPAVSRAVERLEGLGILQEITGKQRGRIYSYAAYLKILSEGTEPLPR